MLLGLLQRYANYLDRPRVLAIPDGAEHEFKLLQHSLDYDSSAARMSDVEGLNLNVYAPASDGTSEDSSLPVFVFIHGGGFNGGSSSYPPHDMTRFVRLSTARGMPVIGVTLKYVHSFPVIAIANSSQLSSRCTRIPPFHRNEGGRLLA
jgi:acetyl esterase/lipase